MISICVRMCKLSNSIQLWLQRKLWMVMTMFGVFKLERVIFFYVPENTGYSAIRMKYCVVFFLVFNFFNTGFFSVAVNTVRVNKWNWFQMAISVTYYTLIRWLVSWRMNCQTLNFVFNYRHTQDLRSSVSPTR